MVVALFACLLAWINAVLIVFAVLSTFVSKLTFGRRLMVAFCSPPVLLLFLLIGPWSSVQTFPVVVVWSVWLSIPAGVLLARWVFVSPGFAGSGGLRVFVLVPLFFYLCFMAMLGFIYAALGLSNWDQALRLSCGSTP